MMNDKKIIFMGTPFISNAYLNVLIENKINIEAVFTQPPKKQQRGMKLNKSPIHLLAEQKNISVFHPEKLDNEVINLLNTIKPDLIIVMAYGKLIPKEILELPTHGCINIHVSILPRWRGASPIEHTLMNGDKETGVSIIKLIEKLDGGPIIAQEKFDIPENTNKSQLSNKLSIIGTKLLLQTIPNILENKINPKYQDEKNVTYAKKITSDDRKINFNNATQHGIDHRGAHAPKPGAWFFFNKERIKLMTKINNEEVKKVAQLARLELNVNEINNHAEQLEKILEYIKQLEKINTDDVPCTTRAIEVTNVFRKDEKKNYDSTEEILELGPSREEQYFKVPKIINE